MPTFWILFWSAFIPAGLIFLIVTKLEALAMKDSAKLSNTHVWVRSGSKTPQRKATRREAWEHDNPGKSYGMHQSGFALFIMLLLMIGVTALLGSIADENLLLPESGFNRAFQQCGSSLLGGIFGFVFWGVLISGVGELDSGIIRTLRILALIPTLAAIVLFILPAFISFSFVLPFSHHWLWAGFGFLLILAILDSALTYRSSRPSRKKRKPGNSKLVYDFLFKITEYVTFSPEYRQHQKGMHTVVTLAREMLLQGDFDNLLESKSFFNSLEHVLLDVIRDRQFSIDDSEIRQVFPEIMQTVQSFYFYGVKHLGHKLHPRIKAALKK